MMDKMIFGRYIPGDSLIHRMDPRSKIISILIFICIVFLANNIYTYSLLTLFVLLIIYLTRLKVTFLLNGLRPVVYLIIFTFVLQLFFTREGEIIFSLGWIKIYEMGLKQAIFISLRFFLLVLVTSLLTLTTTPITLTDGIETLLNPLKKVKFPVHELALMMSISLRFIPTLMDELDKIMKAQIARGVEFSSGSIKQRIQAIIPLLIPLFISSFKRAEELSVAMEARGYRGGEGRTKYRLLEWKAVDTLAIVILLGLAGVLIVLRT